MRKTAALLWLLCFAFTANAQENLLKGSVADTLNKQVLHNAVVSLLRPKDSVLIKYVRTDQQGNFQLNGVPNGKFLILVSYPNYADYLDQLTIDDTHS
ncbi:MAG TPA: TonB-dependent receptor, partial [Chitinophagaceae bacterium]|nr:TonB-dependent receptor [Chitinophagaceae bacterium]